MFKITLLPRLPLPCLFPPSLCLWLCLCLLLLRKASVSVCFFLDVFLIVNVIFSLTGALTKVGVEFNGESRALKLPLTSLEGVVTSLLEKLSITSPFTVQYYDEVVKKCILLDDIENLLKEGIKFKVVAQALSWWSWAPYASWSLKGYTATPYHSLLVKEESHIHHPSALDKFKDAA